MLRAGGSEQNAIGGNCQPGVRKAEIKGRDPIGLRLGGEDPKDPHWVIVGVVGDTKFQDLRSTDAPTTYVPLTERGATFVLRTAAQPAVFMPAVREAVNQADEQLAGDPDEDAI